MRTLLAALFVLVVTSGTFLLVDLCFAHQAWPWWGKVLPAVALVVSLLLSSVLFNGTAFRLGIRGRSLQEQIAALDAAGLLRRQTFEARRAFVVGEFEDEGPHYCIELTDARVLYLNGQYLYDYEPITDEPELNQPRMFPCTQFVILRHKDEGDVVHLECAGDPFEPEVAAATFPLEFLGRHDLEDGEIVPDRSYESLKSEFTKSSASPEP